MNLYRISHSTPGEEMQTSHITERSESAARRAFKKLGTGSDIFSVELLHEDALATKEQERETLAAIRKMVAELGPQSYLSTAFEGCFADAESNIENDFGDSMKLRFEHEVEKVAELTKTIEELRRSVVEEHRAREAAEEAARATEQRTPTADDLSDCVALVRDRAYEHETKMNEAAARIVELASQPESPEFQQAVKEHRNEKSSLEYSKALQERLNQNIRAGA